MDKNKVKGFTLIELIVVMAIFMIVLVAAMSFMQPVQKMVIQADTRESGAAQVNSISNYLQSELGSAEYLMITNNVTRDSNDKVSDAKCRQYVDAYVRRYYEGVLKKGSTPDAIAYGKGKVHVLTIDNTKGGEITKSVYEVKFDIGNSFCGNKIAAESTESPINKAYYDNTSYVIELGGNGNMLTKDQTDPAVFLSSIRATDTTFNITANITRGTAHPKVYQFTTSATVPLVNIMERTSCVTGKYFVIKEKENGQPTYSKTIVDVAKDTGIVGQDTESANTLTRHEGSLANKSSIWVNPEPGNTVYGGPNSKYTFVYSYGNEMLTNY